VKYYPDIFVPIRSQLFKYPQLAAFPQQRSHTLTPSVGLMVEVTASCCQSD